MESLPGGKMILMAVVPDDLFGIEVPNIFQVHIAECQIFVSAIVPPLYHDVVGQRIAVIINLH